MSLRSLIAALLLIPALTPMMSAQTPTASLKVRHIHIWVKDVKRTKAFYSDKLGFKVSAEKPGENVEFDGGLWFGKWKESSPLDTSAITIGLGTDSVDAAYQMLKQKKVDLLNAPSEAHGEWHFIVQDPDGYKIEVEGPK